jgi:adenine phosphoribosyltransferase
MSVRHAPQERVAALKANVREIEDFPRKGIFTQDVTPLFSDPALFALTIEELARLVSNERVDAVAGIYSRGYMFGPPLAARLGVRFIPIPKSDEASPSAARESYTYEYSSDTLALDADAIRPGMRVLIVDDQLATGGTALAAATLVERHSGIVAGLAFILTQARYNGLENVSKYPVLALFAK